MNIDYETLVRIFFSLCLGGLSFIGGFAGLNIEGANAVTVATAIFFVVLGVLSQIIVWRVD